MNQLGYWFKELEQLIGLEQNPKYHPEGDVWTHTMIVLDNAAKFRNEVSDAYSFMLFALMHDLGKIETTEIINGKIHSYNHEVVGVEIAERLLERVCRYAFPTAGDCGGAFARTLVSSAWFRVVRIPIRGGTRRRRSRRRFPSSFGLRPCCVRIVPRSRAVR